MSRAGMKKSVKKTHHKKHTAPPQKSRRHEKILRWLDANEIEEVELFFPDLTGMLRGKIVPIDVFLRGDVRLPYSVIGQAVTGDWWGMQDEMTSDHRGDIVLVPDPNALYKAPWVTNYNIAQVICDCKLRDRTVRSTPRAILKRVLQLYKKQGLAPIVAPEFEFYFIKKDKNYDNPLEPADGYTGRPMVTSQPYSIDAVNEYDPVINDIYGYTEAQGLQVDTLAHEEGIAQFEINFKHGEPLSVADQSLMYKRCVREAANRRNVVATFMAKPIQQQPGSSMHIHASILNRDGHNLFQSKSETQSKYLQHFVGGIQRYLPESLLFFLPNINSFRRANSLQSNVNIHWGEYNRTVGIRIPDKARSPAARIELRVPGSDANPYLAFAALLLAGLNGLNQKIEPLPPVRVHFEDSDTGLPTHIEDALTRMNESTMLRETMGNQFIDLYIATKMTELENHRHVISQWERRHLLHTV